MVDELLTWADTVKIRVKSLPDTLEKLTAAAEEAYSSRQIEFIPSRAALVAYVRHNLTNYENLLDYIRGRQGWHEAYPRLKERVNQTVEQKLDERYPS